MPVNVRTVKVSNNYGIGTSEEFMTAFWNLGIEERLTEGGIGKLERKTGRRHMTTLLIAHGFLMFTRSVNRRECCIQPCYEWSIN